MGESARRLGIAATSALTSAPTASPASPAVATRTPTVISLELAGPDDNECSVDSSLPSAPAPLLDSSAATSSSTPPRAPRSASRTLTPRSPSSTKHSSVSFHSPAAPLVSATTGCWPLRWRWRSRSPRSTSPRGSASTTSSATTTTWRRRAGPWPPASTSPAPDAVLDVLRRFITNPGVPFVGPGSAHDGHIPEESYVTASRSLSSAAGGNAHPTSLKLVVPEEEDAVPRTLADRCLMNFLILSQSCFSSPFRCSWDAVLHRQHRPWALPSELRLMSCDAGLRPLPWPSFDLAESA